MKKIHDDAASALDGLLQDGMLIAAGGFGLCGIPELLLAAIRDSGVKDLTFASNNAGVDDFGIGILLQTRQVRRMISSYVGENAEFMRQFLAGELEIEFTPQGTAGRADAGGRRGDPGLLHQDRRRHPRSPRARRRRCSTGRPTSSSEGSSRTWPSSRRGRPTRPATSCSARRRATSTRRRAACGRVCVAEVEEIVPRGALDGDMIHLPGIYVHRLIQGEHEKRIEQRTTRPRSAAALRGDLMTLKASDVESLLRDAGSGEVFVEMDEGEVEMDTGHPDLAALAEAQGYRMGDRDTRDGRVGRVFHPKPAGA